MSSPTQNKSRIHRISNRIFELVLFAMFAALMFTTKQAMSPLPNIHLLGMLTILYTVVFRYKALIPIYLYVFFEGLYWGFSPWWLPYTYIWTVLWFITMLLPKNMPRKAAMIVYPIVCSLHGLAYGILYAPSQALIAGLNFEETLAWISFGFPYDIIHGVSNIFMGMLVYPLAELIKKLLRLSRRGSVS